VDNGSHSANNGTLTLNGSGAAGIYIDKSNAAASGTSTLTGAGTINGVAVTTAGDMRVGVYVSRGDFSGVDPYTFLVDGGVAIYLKNGVISYGGLLTLGADSTAVSRAIGLYAESGVTGALGLDMTVSGDNAVGIYLAGTGGSGANITYNGKLELTATGSTSTERGVGVVLDAGSTFSLGAAGAVDIG